MSSLPLGNITDINGFSPANFDEVEDSRPLNVQIDPTGTGTYTPYSVLVTNALQRHTTEIKQKTESPSATLPNWKRRFRDFMTLKNEDLVNFLRNPSRAQTPLARADTFLQKFGRPDFNPTHASLQNIQLDVSGVSCIASLEREIKEIGPSSPKEILEQIRWLYDEYRAAGDKCIVAENELRVRLDTLDRTYQKIVGFSELPENEYTEKLAASIETYVKQLMDENQIEKEYTNTVEAYRRFAALRETIQFFRFTDLQDKEPLCSICLTETVGFVLVPCGHTLCGTCLKRQTSSCYMCRTMVKEKVKLYFG